MDTYKQQLTKCQPDEDQLTWTYHMNPWTKNWMDTYHHHHLKCGIIFHFKCAHTHEHYSYTCTTDIYFISKVLHDVLCTHDVCVPFEFEFHVYFSFHLILIQITWWLSYILSHSKTTHILHFMLIYLTLFHPKLDFK